VLSAVHILLGGETFVQKYFNNVEKRDFLAFLEMGDLEERGVIERLGHHTLQGLDKCRQKEKGFFSNQIRKKALRASFPSIMLQKNNNNFLNIQHPCFFGSIPMHRGAVLLMLGSLRAPLLAWPIVEQVRLHCPNARPQQKPQS